jgi:hypothetical protein
MCNVLKDIKLSRLTYLHDVLGARAARNYEFSKVMTSAGNGHSHKKERMARQGRQFEILTSLFWDLEDICCHERWIIEKKGCWQKKACWQGKILPPLL